MKEERKKNERKSERERKGRKHATREREKTNEKLSRTRKPILNLNSEKGPGLRSRVRQRVGPVGFIRWSPLLGLRDVDLNPFEQNTQLAKTLMESGQQTFFAFVILSGQNGHSPDLKVSAHVIPSSSMQIHKPTVQIHNQVRCGSAGIRVRDPARVICSA